MLFLLKFHGGLRWLIALAAIVAIVRFAYGWARRAEYKGLDRGLMAGITGLLDLNFLLGVILLFTLGGGWPSHRMEHVVTMVLALVVIHSSAMWRRSDNAATKFRNNLISLVVVLALVAVAVLRLRGGWLF